MNSDWKEDVKQNAKTYEKFLDELKYKSYKEIDEVSLKLSVEAYKTNDCLSCANCCKTAPTVIKDSEIKRIAGKLGISKKQFLSKYIFEDINGELTINTIPCPFLAKDNSCDIYDVRPEVCRSYPHTDQTNFVRKLNFHKRNISYCPITLDVVKGMMNHFNKENNL